MEWRRFVTYLSNDPRTHPLQFGLKRNMCCSHALFVISQVANYFVKHGSNVSLYAT